jgi:xylitol oxidase
MAQPTRGALENWGGNYTFGARAVHVPTTLEQLREIVTRAPRVRVLGTRHSFTSIADSDELLRLDQLSAEVAVDREALTVTCTGAVRYGELAAALEREGLALANLASLPHIAVAGAISTATHGSGDRNGNLAASVIALELLTSDGRLDTVSRGDPDFEGVVVGLGAVGVVTRVTLEVEPSFEVRQRVFEELQWEALYEHLDEIMASGYSVSVFTLWDEQAVRIWVKQRVGERDLGERLFGARAAARPQHPIAGIDPAHATPQLGLPGPWLDRLPHFRMQFTPSVGAEIQSEYIVARRHALDAIRAVRDIGGIVTPLLLVGEIRTVAADSLWLSPQYEQDTLGLHFTWKRDQEAVERALAEIERALAPFDARPHWGKLFLMEAPAIARLYERLGDFTRLRDRLDPRGAFRNEWFERYVAGPR